MNQERLMRGAGYTFSMPRFTIKDLLLSAACVSVGSALLGIIFRNSPGAKEVGLPLWFIGGILIGVGIFVPFKRPGIGAIVGMFVQHALLFIVVSLRGSTPVASYLPLFICATLLSGGMAVAWLLWWITRSQ